VTRSISLERAAELYSFGPGKVRRTPKAPSIEVTCAVCGRVFLSFYASAKYCPAAVSDCGYQIKIKRKRVQRACVVCGEPFAARRRDHIYCGRACQYRARLAREET